MRKIISKKKENKKKKIKQFIVGGVLILVMVLSIIGYSFNSGNDELTEVTYNGFKFTEESGYWFTDIEDFQFSFKYNPNDVEEIDSQLNYLNTYYDEPLYFYSENPEATTEIYRNLFYYNQIVQRVQEACPENEKCEGDIPTKDCTNNFIIIKESNNSEIKQQDNCVFISGKYEDLIKSSDSFLLKIIGVQ